MFSYINSVRLVRIILNLHHSQPCTAAYDE
jgi:hypothetical protein